MSFEIKPVQGDIAELESDLSSPPQHEREELVIPVVKESIAKIVEALQGYLSISCNGSINPVAGENGDSINIYITSLTAPMAPTPPVTEVPVTPPVEIGTPPVQTPTPPVVETPVVTELPIVETPPVVETSLEPPIVSIPPAGEAGQELPQTNEPIPSPIPPVVTENPAENPPVPTGEGAGPIAEQQIGRAH